MSTVARAARVEDAPLRKVRLWQPDIRVERRPDGTVRVRQAAELGPYPEKLTERLVQYATTAPERVYLADRGDDGAWRTLTYGETLARVRRLGEALLGFGLSAERPLVILSGNDLEHALLGLAAQYVGVPYAPISTAYSLVSADFSKLKDIAALLTPGLVFAADGNPYTAAINAAIPAGIPVIVVANPVAGRRGATFAELVATEESSAVDAAYDAVGPDTIAKFLFTSGSTGSPKAVINTQRMICSNQEMVRDCYAFMQDEPPIVLDWAPWNHTAGGNKVFNMVLNNGGSFYIDDGRPTHEGIGKTVRNLKEVAPTWYFNVPKGFRGTDPAPEIRPRAAGAFLQPAELHDVRRRRSRPAYMGRAGGTGGASHR